MDIMVLICDIYVFMHIYIYIYIYIFTLIIKFVCFYCSVTVYKTTKNIFLKSQLYFSEVLQRTDNETKSVKTAYS